ncbi:MAG: MCE family protein, partial [Chitinophagaceae bacterium]|nr:MCE family protein [Rubrivivax sp.]
MEDKLNYTLVGAFVLALGAGLVAAVLWLAAGVGGKKQLDVYESIVRESVAGLNVDAPVKYLGVDVGKVNAITIDPQNSRQVRLRLLIERGTPIKQDTEAVLKIQGLTGIAHVELDGGSPDAPPLRFVAGGPPPLIPSKPSLSARLENVLGSVLSSVDRVSNNLSAMLDTDNRAALKQTLADMAAVARTLAEQQGVIKSVLADGAQAAKQLAGASEQFTPTLARISSSAQAVEKL